jgi:hypothetical protein
VEEISLNPVTVCEQLKRNLAIKDAADWYNKLTKPIVESQVGGAYCVCKAIGSALRVFESELRWYAGPALLERYHGRLASILNAAYPGDHKWVDWKFANQSVPFRFWDDRSNREAFFRQLAVEKNITRPEDWYKIGIKDIQAAGGSLDCAFVEIEFLGSRSDSLVCD